MSSLRFGPSRVTLEQAACILAINETPMASDVLANYDDYFRSGYSNPQTEFAVVDELPLRKMMPSPLVPTHRFILRPSKLVPSGTVALARPELLGPDRGLRSVPR